MNKHTPSQLVEYIGGLEKSLEALEVLRQHKNCCDRWYMQDVYGKGRAARKVVGKQLALFCGEVGIEKSFSLKELESVIESVLTSHLHSYRGLAKVVYNSPQELPETSFGESPSDLWEQSVPLLIKWQGSGKVEYSSGSYMTPNYEHDGKYAHWKISGCNGNWDEYVLGWAYA